MNTCDRSASAHSCSTSRHFDLARFLPARVHSRLHRLHTLCTRQSFHCLPACKLARATEFHPHPFLRFPIHRTHCNTSAEMVSVRSRPLVNLPDLLLSGRRSDRTKYLLAFSDFAPKAYCFSELADSFLHTKTLSASSIFVKVL
jgi:hypothetical protein